MTTIQEPAQVDIDKLMAFVFRAVDEVGATLNAALVVMGDKLGYYRDLADARPEHAGRARRADRHRASRTPASGSTPRPPAAYVDYDPATGDLHAAARAGRRAHRRGQPGLPARLLPDRAGHGARHRAHRRGGPQRRRLRLARARHRRPRRLRALLPARATTRTSWPSGCRRSTAWSTSSTRGAKVADVGCGHGASTILMAQAFPASTFVGSDYHAESIEIARARAAEAGVADRVTLRGRHGAARSAAPATTW